MNHKEGAYEFMVHDGMRIRSTTANLRIVGDCFPFKYQQKRDLDLDINPRVDELEDDDENLIANVGSAAEEAERPSALSCGGVDDLVDEATHAHDQELRRIFAFVRRSRNGHTMTVTKRVADARPAKRERRS